jgi:hypothetical protein
MFTRTRRAAPSFFAMRAADFFDVVADFTSIDDEVSTHKAERRAQRLLEANLTPLQRACLHRTGYFEVIGGESGERYLVGASGNVTLYGALGTIARGFCVSAPGVPLPDRALTMALMIQHDEEKFLSRANWIGSPESAAYRRLRRICNGLTR